MTKLLAIIDADSLCFFSSKDTIEESINNINERIENIFQQTQCTHYCMFVSKGKYFRHGIDPNYKGSRKQSNLKYLKTLKSYLVEQWNAQSMDGVEADDLAAYWMNNQLKYQPQKGANNIDTGYFCTDGFNICTDVEPVSKILCAIDKDLICSIPGRHWNFTYRLANRDNLDSLMKGYWVETTNIIGQCEYFKAKQLLMGDYSDGIHALEKVGDKTADKILSVAQDNADTLIPIVFNEYINRLGISEGIFQFQKNYRLLHMLSTNEDFMREIGKVPDMPIITEVKRELSIERQIEDLI